VHALHEVNIDIADSSVSGAVSGNVVITVGKRSTGKGFGVNASLHRARRDMRERTGSAITWKTLPDDFLSGAVRKGAGSAVFTLVADVPIISAA
jgi:hypothetical protein